MSEALAMRCGMCGAAAVMRQREDAVAFVAIHQRHDRCGTGALLEVVAAADLVLQDPTPVPPPRHAARRRRRAPAPD